MKKSPAWLVACIGVIFLLSTCEGLGNSSSTISSLEGNENRNDVNSTTEASNDAGDNGGNNSDEKTGEGSNEADLGGNNSDNDGGGSGGSDSGSTGGSDGSGGSDSGSTSESDGSGGSDSGSTSESDGSGGSDGGSTGGSDGSGGSDGGSTGGSDGSGGSDGGGSGNGNSGDDEDDGDSDNNAKLWAFEKTTGLRSREERGVTIYLLSTWRDLEYLSEKSRSSREVLDYRYELSGSIKFPSIESLPQGQSESYARNGFLPIGTDNQPFTGVFDGNNKKIRNVFISQASEDGVGFFGGVKRNGQSGGEIHDLQLTSVYVKGDSKVGGLAGDIHSAVIRNVFVSGTVEAGGSDIGGAIGLSEGGSQIVNAYAQVRVDGVNNVGGLVGHMKSTVVVSNSYAASRKVKGVQFVGGLVGMHTSTQDITKCYATGQVEGVQFIGGLVGQVKKSSIIDTYALGEVKGVQFIGGLVGSHEASKSIINSYSAGAVQGEQHIGGLVGDAPGKNIIENSYWSADAQTPLNSRNLRRPITGIGVQTSNSGAEPLTDSEVSQSSFGQWDFSSTWKFDGEVLWPIFHMSEMYGS